MTNYRTNLAKYLAHRKAICTTFFTAAAEAEVTCENTTKLAINALEQNAAQAALTSQIRTASKTFSEALEDLGPPPVLPI
jgi:hypothetical protein